jgi:hypothetical protein
MINLGQGLLRTVIHALDDSPTVHYITASLSQILERAGRKSVILVNLRRLHARGKLLGAEPLQETREM